MNLTDSAIEKFYPDGKEPVFAAPWEAHAFALTVKLHEHGAFSWAEWSAELAQSIRNDPRAAYYDSWLDALVKLLAKKEIVDAKVLIEEMDALKADH